MVSVSGPAAPVRLIDAGEREAAECSRVAGRDCVRVVVRLRPPAGVGDFRRCNHIIKMISICMLSGMCPDTKNEQPSMLRAICVMLRCKRGATPEPRRSGFEPMAPWQMGEYGGCSNCWGDAPHC